MAKERLYRNIAVVGASGGGVEALQKLVAALPTDYRGTLFVVLHVPPDSPSLLARILDRAGPLPAQAAFDGATFEPGQIWVSQPDRHLVLEKGCMRLAHGPRENRHRPAIDVLFRSAAIAYGPRVTGVVLTGSLDDGAAGLWAIKMRAGVTIVQDPADALYPEMPQNALDTVDVNHCLPLAQIPGALVRLACEVALPGGAEPDSRMELEVTMASQSSATIDQLDEIGTRSELTCPECGGALWQMEDPPPRFRCHVGHGYTMKSLISAQTERVESALWAGLRGLEESEALARRLAEGARERGHDRSALQYDERAREDADHAQVLRQMLRTIPHEVSALGASGGIGEEPALASGASPEGQTVE